MYAFNKRFRPTTWNGIGAGAGICFAVGLVLMAISAGSAILTKNFGLSGFLFLTGLVLVITGFRIHMGMKTARIRWALITGRKDSRAPSKEIANA